MRKGRFFGSGQINDKPRGPGGVLLFKRLCFSALVWVLVGGGLAVISCGHLNQSAEVGMTDETKGLSEIGDVAATLGNAASASGTPDVASFLGHMSMTTIMISLVAGLVGSAYF